MLNKTFSNIKKNNFASIAVYSQGWGVQFKGVIEFSDNGNWFDFVKNSVDNADYSPKAAIIFLVREIWDLDNGARLV